MSVKGDSNGSIADYFNDSFRLVKNDIDSADNSIILNTDIDKLVNNYYDEYSLPTIEIDPDRGNILEQNNRNASEDKSHIFGIPIILQDNLDVVISRTADNRLLMVNFKLEDGYMIHKIDRDVKQIDKSRIQRIQSDLNTIITQKNYTVTSRNTWFKNMIESYLKQSKEEIHEDKEKIRAGNIHLDQLRDELSLESTKNNDAPNYESSDKTESSDNKT